MDKMSITRLVLLVVAVLNAVLNLLGYQTVSDDTTNDLVALVSGVIMLWAGWKNMYISRKGLAQKDVLDKHGLK